MPVALILEFSVILFITFQSPYNPDTDNSMIPENYHSFLSKCLEFDYRERWNIKDVIDYLNPKPSGKINVHSYYSFYQLFYMYF